MGERRWGAVKTDDCIIPAQLHYCPTLPPVPEAERGISDQELVSLLEAFLLHSFVYVNRRTAGGTGLKFKKGGVS